MADIIDRANNLAEQLINNKLKNRKTVFVGVSAKNCIECDEPIPEKRRQLLQGVKLCVDCQKINEMRAK